ncbi:membrane protein [Spirochaetia bacterium]|nr:membrane protein [Spirochaetia bacterium]GHU36795.1 membrane protein [Spirochaetia bacterium]
MKHGSFRAVCLILMACIAVVSAFGDEITERLESRVLESFNGDDSDYTWELRASQFATKTERVDGEVVTLDVPFPRANPTVPVFPAAQFSKKEFPDGVQSYGIWGKFDRQGYNWIDIYPVSKEDDPEIADKGIPVDGRLKTIDLWVWGSNLNYYVEAYFRDYQGKIHSVILGDLNYTGWKNLKASIPTSIPQVQKMQPRFQALHFLKFRVWTRPTERVDNFYIYLSRFNIVRDTFEAFYDGQDVADLQDVWNR